MGRYKTLIGPRLRARGFAGQQTEAAIGVAVLNRMLVAVDDSLTIRCVYRIGPCSRQPTKRTGGRIFSVRWRCWRRPAHGCPLVCQIRCCAVAPQWNFIPVVCGRPRTLKLSHPTPEAGCRIVRGWILLV
jgi:hypothetical protein